MLTKEERIAKEEKAAATYKEWKDTMKQKRQDNIDEFVETVDEELKKYDSNKESNK